MSGLKKKIPKNRPAAQTSIPKKSYAGKAQRANMARLRKMGGIKGQKQTRGR